MQATLRALPIATLPIAILLAIPSISATAADWKPLKGTVAMTAKNYLDPSDKEAHDSHIRFQLAGDSARDLYRAMKVVAKPDECTGALAKRVGEMRCLFFAQEKKYACHFAIDIMRQTIEYGIGC